MPSSKKNTNNYISRLTLFYKQADELIKKNKNLDREIIVQTMLALQKTPWNRLKAALLRGKMIHAQ